MASFYQQGKLDEAIPVAEKIVKLEREKKSPNQQNLLTSLENLSQLKSERFKQTLAELVSPDLKPDKVRNLLEKMRKDGTENEVIYREALALGENNPNIPKEQITGIKNNFAWLLYKYFPNQANLPVGFDKLSKDQFDSLNRSRFYERINEAEKLYNEALKMSETAFGADNDITLLSLYNFAEFNLAKGNFEAAINQYKRFINVIEKKYGENSKDLVPPLESYVKILIATNQNDLVMDVISRIVRITGKSKQVPKSLLNISLRSDKSFETINSPLVEQRQRSNSDRVYMSRQGSLITSGVTGESFGIASISGSTFGKSYYDNPQAVKIIRIPVRIVIDENGNPIETEAMTDDKEFKISAEKNVIQWKFRPFMIDGKPMKITGYVECLFLDEKFLR